MKTLPESFTKKGFQFQLEERSGKVAIYRRWKKDQPPHWEVVVVRVAPASKFSVDEMKNGQIRTRLIEREEGEVYPSDNQWGDLGWTFHSLEAARKKASQKSLNT